MAGCSADLMALCNLCGSKRPNPGEPLGLDFKWPNRHCLTVMIRALMRPHKIKTAGCLIIGDEVLNGKIHDTNSWTFAKYCFDLGIELRRVSVVPDEEADIVAAIKDLSKFDFVVTSGGIGPTHDDITYESIARAYNLPLKLDQETEDLMNIYSKYKPKDRPPAERAAALRMATLPSGDNVSKLYAVKDMWVPVVGIDHRVYILPGIPRLFQQLLEGLKPSIVERLDATVMERRFVSTKATESTLAGPLGELQKKYKDQGVKVGSYPHINIQRNTVSLIAPKSLELGDKLVQEVLEKIDGHEISAEEEAKAN